jgi:elongation factor 1 alpha-like protein
VNIEQNYLSYVQRSCQCWLTPLRRTGCVLCPPSDLVPLVTSFAAQIIVFDINVPILSGAAVELFHHSRDTPATISKLQATLDKTNGSIIKQNPRCATQLAFRLRVDDADRMLQGGVSARVLIQLRSPAIPIEAFSVNKGMGRILLRREGHTCVVDLLLWCD